MIYSRSGWNGGKLAFLLGCSVSFPHGNEDDRHAWTRNRTRKLILPRSINLGCRKRYLSDTKCFNYDSAFSSDKVKSFEAFDKAGIPHPRVISEKSIISRSSEVPEIFLGRKNGSFAGRGIVKYSPRSWRRTKEKSGWQGHDFYVEFLEFKSEHRIHVFQGTAVCYLNKIVKAGSEDFVHTLEHGFPMEIGPLQTSSQVTCKMEELAIKAVSACGLDFGAVDLFIDQKDNIYVLEVNSDPGMPGVIGFLYADRFRQVFNLDMPDYYFVNHQGGVSEVEETFFFRNREAKRKKLSVKNEDFNYRNEGIKMKK